MGVEYRDYYKILGVDKTATTEEIGKAYKKLARKFHPDLNQGDKGAEERFKDINEAHEVLKDKEKRRLYDQLGPNWQNGQNFKHPPGFENVRFEFGGMGHGDSGFSDFFEILFGGGGGRSFSGNFGGGAFDDAGFGRRRPRKGQDVEVAFLLSLEEAFNGGKKTVTLTGAPGSAQRSLEVNIPSGVRNGARIRLAGQGHAGSQGGPAGDLFLKAEIAAHPLFKLDDADVIYDLHIPPWDAALGARITIPTLSGQVALTIAPGTGSGKKLRLRGKGLGSGKNKGDQLVRIFIDVSEPDGPETRRLWETLRAACSG
ncbi:MAG: J domain-containing protein [Desulfovibrio sp.]|jgi:curved DNA-binding protein|nr:J domain-containing protein [Desulfovibrio sp.]